MRFRIAGFDLNLHIDAEFALRDIGRCDSKKFFTILQMTMFFFTLLTRKIGSKLSL